MSRSKSRVRRRNEKRLYELQNGFFCPVNLPGNFDTVQELWQELQAARKAAAAMVDRGIEREHYQNQLDRVKFPAYTEHGYFESKADYLQWYEGEKQKAIEGMQNQYKKWGLDSRPMARVADIDKALPE